jgi:hypothetical protein
MIIQMSDGIPSSYQKKKPIKTYETTFLYTGISRYNTTTKTLSNFELKEDKVFYKEVPYEGTVFSRSYNAEPVRMIIYSEQPKVWAEELSPFHVHFFQQIPQNETT